MVASSLLLNSLKEASLEECKDKEALVDRCHSSSPLSCQVNLNLHLEDHLQELSDNLLEASEEVQHKLEEQVASVHSNQLLLPSHQSPVVVVFMVVD